MSATDSTCVAAQQSSVDEDHGKSKRRGLKLLRETSYQGKKCARCGAPFGRFYNTGAPCPRCKFRVCRQCRESKGAIENNKECNVDWLCTVCHKISELRAVSGEWMYESIKHCAGRDETLSPLDILKYSIRRAWTINGPPVRWSRTRKLPEYRVYRSLPSRHHNYNHGDIVAAINENNRELGNRRDNASCDTVDRTGIAVDDERASLKKSDRSASKSFLKAPKVLTKSISSPECGKNTPKHGERKSNIPIFRRSSREFEDIRSPQESPKRSLIPQRYRGSTDDLRRSREDISVPSFIPKLLSPRHKEEKLKRQDSKDDIRFFFKPNRKEESKVSSPTVGKVLKLAKEENDNFLTNKEEDQEFDEDILEEEEMVNELTNLEGSIEEPMLNKRCKSEEKLIEVKTSDRKNDEEVEMDGADDAKTDGQEIDVENTGNESSESNAEKKSPEATEKKSEEIVVRRNAVKEESSNPDDTDDTPNRRCSSHLSPEASPLSTRSSRYSPRESESEPTPALPRKIACGDSTTSSQRIRDAISRTRRESNSSTRYESSGSESVRLSESGLQNYVDLTRRVKLFDGSGLSSFGGYCDEIIQRDSATSAGEDEPHGDIHVREVGRTGPGSSQNRVILRKRRQFDAQGSRRRGRSHARSCCGEDLQSLQALHAISRRRSSPPDCVGPLHVQETPIVDYRRLVFISSDSSSGREEDDADSSCSSSSYLNDGPRGSYAQSLEDCDWDYFESGTLPLPPGISFPINSPAHQTNTSNSQDWSCCPGRGTSACQACGGARGANVLPVPVPIPVPVPYPVPVPASLWTSDLAAASSMINRDTTLEGTLRLRNDPAWLAWQSRFNQPLAGVRIDPASFSFYSEVAASTVLTESSQFPSFEVSSLKQDEKEQKQDDQQDVPNNNVESNSSNLNEVKEDVIEVKSEEKSDEEKDEIESDKEFEGRMYRLSQGDSGSSSGRSSADSSDLEDSATHHYSREYVVNEDSLSESEIGHNEELDSGVKRMRPEQIEEPVILRCIRPLDEDNIQNNEEPKEPPVDQKEESLHEMRKYCLKNAFIYYANELYVADSDDCAESRILLKSIKSIDPEERFERKLRCDEDVPKFATESEPSSMVVPDSLEVAVPEASKSAANSSVQSESLTESTATGSELSSDELHEYEVSAEVNNTCVVGSVEELISTKIEEILRSAEVCNDESVRAEGGASEQVGGDCERGVARLRSVERRACSAKENGLPAVPEQQNENAPSNNKYKSLVMITQGSYQPVSVITSDTTTLLQPDEAESSQGLAGYFQLALEAVGAEPRRTTAPRRPLTVKRNPAVGVETEVDSGLSVGSASESDDVLPAKKLCQIREPEPQSDESPRHQQSSEENSSSGVVILEEGLADDDSWVEEVSHDEDEQSLSSQQATEESSEDEAHHLGDREEELRGYHRQAIDFTLHTIVEESCEESEAEPSLRGGSPKKRLQRPPSASELEKYFFFGLGGDSNASAGSREIDSLSETSSIYSEGLESLGQEESNANSSQEKTGDSLNSSRLEKYFLSEFLGFDQSRRDSDGSVGSDSEGRPSPEAQRRKKLVRARGTGRSHSSSLDNLLALQNSQNQSSQNSLQDLSLNQDGAESQSEGSSTETDGAEDNQAPAFGTDGQFDTVKRKKKKPRTLGTQSPRVPEDRNKTPEPRDLVVELPEGEEETLNSDDERSKTPQPENGAIQICQSDASGDLSGSRSKHQSRDSGFIGSCDDLLQSQKPSEKETDQSSSTDRKLDDISQLHEKLQSKKVDQPLHPSMPSIQASLSRKDSFNNWSSDEETNLMMSKMRQFFKTMVATANNNQQSSSNPSPSPRLTGYSKARHCAQNRTKPPQLVYFENELTRLMKTVPGIRDEQVREIVEYLSSEDTWSDSYDSSDYTSSDLEGAAGGRRSALQEQISQSCQQIISKFDMNSDETMVFDKDNLEQDRIQPCIGRDTAFVYQKLVQSFTKIAGDSPSSETNPTPHSSPPLIAKVMQHIGSRLVALMHEVSEGGSTSQHSHATWRRYSHHHRAPSSASTTEDDDSTSDSNNATSQLPRSKSHDPLLLLSNHPNANTAQDGEEKEASDYERFSWRGSFESALMAADSRNKLSLLACSGDVSASASASALAMAAKRRSAGDLLFNPKSFSREQLDRVRSCGSIGGGTGERVVCSGSIEDKIWTNRRRSSVPDANTRGESGASAGDDDTEDELEYDGDSRATTLPRGMQAAVASSSTSATNSLPRLSASAVSGNQGSAMMNMHKAHSMYHFFPQHTGVKSARYRPPGFARNSGNAASSVNSKRAFSAPGLQISGSQSSIGKRERETSRSRRQQAMAIPTDDGSSLSEACSTPIIGGGSRVAHNNMVLDIDDIDRTLHASHLATRASLSSLGARSDSMASVYSGAGEGRWCGSVAVRGEVEFSLQYDYKHLTFEVHVTQCRDLAPVDTKRNRSDPYVKVYLLPDKSKSGKRKTKVKKHTLNPVFDETLKFHMSLNGLETRTLWLTVWHSDMFGRNDFLGEVRMPLENKIFDDPRPQWYPLQERTEPFDDPVTYKGEVIVGLKFVPPDPAQQKREVEDDYISSSKTKKNWSRGSLHILVKEARNLQTRAKNTGTCDPFCKSYLLPDRGRSGKQKTGVVRKSDGSPTWNHTFVYKDVSLQELAERGLELTVWDHDRIASNEFIGGVRFNLGSGKHYGKSVDWMDATGRELSLWQSMLERPNFWVEGAVMLRPNLHNHGKSNSAS